MSNAVGIIGTGHLASYLVEGLRRAAPKLEIILSPRNAARAAELAARFGATVVSTNQEVADAATIILLTTRPADAVPALRQTTFRPDQLIISAAAGVGLQALAAAATPASAVRAIPISCAAINASPTLLYPDDPRARALLELVGHIHALDSEEAFERATAISTFYGWLFALLDTAAQWVAADGVPPEAARRLVLETAQGAARLGLARPQEELTALLERLATPGGITRQGLGILRDRGGFGAWIEALDAVYARLAQTGREADLG
jgi:pyrroline-5-carboxylate reductase